MNGDNDPQAIYTNELRICIKGMTKRLIDIDEDALADLAGFNLRRSIRRLAMMDPAARFC
jgi:hypothetical protein